MCSAGGNNLIFVKAKGKGLQDIFHLAVEYHTSEPTVQDVSGEIYS
jgi:hypothetical protein